VLPQSNTNRIEEDQEFENSTYEAMRETEVAFQQAVNSTFLAIQSAVNTTFEVPGGSGTAASTEGSQEGNQVYWDRNGRWVEWGGDWWKLTSSGWWEKWKAK